jgi:hypothetical protein
MSSVGLVVSAQKAGAGEKKEISAVKVHATPI